VFGYIGGQRIKEDFSGRPSDSECEWVLLVVEFEFSFLRLLASRSRKLFFGDLVLLVCGISDVYM
jgi:hypothetical protein